MHTGGTFPHFRTRLTRNTHGAPTRERRDIAAHDGGGVFGLREPEELQRLEHQRSALRCRRGAMITETLGHESLEKRSSHCARRINLRFRCRAGHAGAARAGDLLGRHLNTRSLCD